MDRLSDRAADVVNASKTPAPDRSPARIAGMFDAIAPRYDLLNHLLSAGLDRRWRRRAVAALDLTGCETLLDLCTGTGDLALAAAAGPGGAARVIGVDFAPEMLRRAAAKVRRAGLEHVVELVRGDAVRLPLATGSIDRAAIAFGIRNVAEPERACAELARVLRPGGRLVVLEFGFPRIPGIRTLYRWYFRYLLPRIGRAVSGHGDAYAYLPASVHAFPSAEAFARLLRDAGFDRVTYRALTLGIAYVYVAVRR